MTTATSAPPEPYVSRVRRLPLPVTDPPFDDELGIVLPRGDRRAPERPPAAGTPVQGTLPLDLEPGGVFDDQLQPIGDEAAVADSLWLRHPGPQPHPPAPRPPVPSASPGSPPDRAAAPGSRAARDPAPARAATPADAPSPTPATGSPAPREPTTAHAGRPAHTSSPATGSPARAVAPAGIVPLAPPPGLPSAGAPSAPVPGVACDAGANGVARGAGDAGADGPAGLAEAGGPAAAMPARRRARPGADELPDPRRWIARLAQSALECLHGRRPVQQLVRWTAEPVYRDLSRRAAAQEDAPAVRPRIRSLRVCRVTGSVAEASVVVQLGRAARAVVVRLEADDGRWLCTAFEVVEPGPVQRPGRGARGQRAAQASSNASA